MKTLMIDMDNVITDGLFFDYIQEFLHKEINLEQISTYYLQELIADQKIHFWEWVKEKDFYKDAPLFKDSYEIINKLNEKYDVYIVTAYLWKDTIDISGENLRNKYNYLKNNLPFITPEKYIFTTNKNLMNFDIRIDDKLENLEGASIKLLFSAWHNKNLDEEVLKQKNIIRVNDWSDIEKILLY